MLLLFIYFIFLCCSCSLRYARGFSTASQSSFTPIYFLSTVEFIRFRLVVCERGFLSYAQNTSTQPFCSLPLFRARCTTELKSSPKNRFSADFVCNEKQFRCFCAVAFCYFFAFKNRARKREKCCCFSRNLSKCHLNLRFHLRQT